MAQFYPLSIAKITEETTDSVSITFDLPKKYEKHFEFVAGQYITLRANINGKDVRRSYSICASPYDGPKKLLRKKHKPVIRVGVKAVENGQMSQFLVNQVREGDVLQVMPPAGRFVLKDNTSNKNQYVFVAAGSGITPVLSQIKTVLFAEKHARVLLCYGNRSDGNVMFLKELQDLAQAHSERFFLYHFYSRNQSQDKLPDVFYTRIKPSLVYKLAQKHGEGVQATHYFICGPSALIDETMDYLKGREVPQSQLHAEYFTASSSNQVVEEQAEEGSSKSGHLKVTFGGLDYDLAIKPGQKILDAVLDANIDAPFSCQSGVCCTCMAKGESGDFDTSDCISLTDQDKSDGMILTCVSTLKSDSGTVNFDAV